MDQYSPTYFSIISSNRLEPQFDKLNNNYSDHEENDFHDRCSSDLKPVTKTIKKESKMKRDYVPISNRLRLELIEAVFQHGEQVKIAAQKLGINYSSAKAICQVYKREGRCSKKLSRMSHSREDRVVYTVEDASVFVTCSGDSPETQDNVSSYEASTEELLLVVKDPVMESFPTIQKAEERVVANGVEEVEDCIRHQILPHVQPRILDRKQNKNYSQSTNPKTVKTTVLQQPFLCPATEYSKVQPTLMPSLQSNAILSSLIPNLPIQVSNGQSFITSNHASLIHPIHAANPNPYQIFNPMTQQMQDVLPPNIIYPPQQQLTYVYVYAYPQNISIASSQIGGPVLLNPVYHMPTQSMISQLMTNASACRTPHN